MLQGWSPIWRVGPTMGLLVFCGFPAAADTPTKDSAKPSIPVAAPKSTPSAKSVASAPTSKAAAPAKSPTPVPPPAVIDADSAPLANYPPVTPAGSRAAPNLISLRYLKTADGAPRLPTPNPWYVLDPYQDTITRAQFELKMRSLYDPFSAFSAFYDINDQRVVFYPTPEHHLPQFTLHFATPEKTVTTPRWFRTPAEFRAESHPPDRPLEGLRVAIDPGHIGGVWADMEERSTRYHGSPPVREGDLNLITGKLLKDELTRLGAIVFEVRDSTTPVTPYRPVDFMPEAREILVDQSPRGAKLRGFPPDKLNLLFGHRVTELSDFLFYRCSEIIERGNRIRDNFVPDVTITLYIDATPGSGRGRLTDGNANIFFVGGAYTRTEMEDPEMQRKCVYKMVEGGSDIEAEVAADIARVFVERTHLGPVQYGNSATTRLVLPDDAYVVARNLAANREYDGPVICTEPYFMNNRLVYQRLLAGDYDGLHTFDGKPYASIFREYANCVAQGLVSAYGHPLNVAGAAAAPAAK
jgi:N-acetylmuramoyl-L-alanine amidase